MNSAYRVIYSKARNALMVVNELTSSVQKKGVKTVVAATAALIASSSGIAAEVIITGDHSNNHKIASSSAITDRFGGALHGTAFTIQDATFTNNSVSPAENNTVTYDTRGGAVFSIGRVDIANSTFAGNKASSNNNTNPNYWAFGGAVNIDGWNGSISGSTFKNNSADMAGALGSINAQYAWKDPGLAISDSTFESNSAQYNGGALTAYERLTVKNTKFIKNSVTRNDDDGGGAIVFGGHAKASIEGSRFEGNTSASIGGAISTRPVDRNRGATYSYGGAWLDINQSKFIENSVTGESLESHYYKRGTGLGGAIFLGMLGEDWTIGSKTESKGKLRPNTINDTSFERNSASRYGGAIYTEGYLTISGNSSFVGNTAGSKGGAIYVAYLTTTIDAADAADVISFSGNKAGSASNDIYIAAKSSSTINITGTNPATSLAGFEEGTFLVLQGKGTITLEGGIAGEAGTEVRSSGESVTVGSMSDYKGTTKITGGNFTLSSGGFGGDLTVSGGTLVVGDTDASKKISVGTLSLSGGALNALSGKLFTTALGADGSTRDAGTLADANKNIFSGASGTLKLRDALYNLDYVTSAEKALNNANVRIVMLGDLINKESAFEDNKATFDDLDSVGSNTALVQVTVSSGNKDVQIGGTATSGYTHRDESLSVKDVDLGTGSKILITGGKELSLAGNGDEVVKTKEAGKYTITISGEGSNLALGGDGTQGGILQGKVEIDLGATITILGDKLFGIHDLSGAGSVLVGRDDSTGIFHFNADSDFTGLIFVDPDWTGSDRIENAAVAYATSEADLSLKAKTVAGRNSVVVLGESSADEAYAAFSRLEGINGIAWGKDGITAAAYVAKPVSLTTGGLVVDGSLTSADAATVEAGKARIAKQGLLIVNQKLKAPAIEGTVVFEEGSYLGISNAEVGSYQIATSVTDAGAKVLTDNPFITGELEGNKFVAVVNPEEGLESIGSAGIQAMTRRADYVLADAIADRTTENLNANAGPNFWVDVAGEHYRADGFENGAEFKSDAGYGIFGADIALTDHFSAGAALQYGTGTVRSSVNSLKNEVDSWGLTAYSAYSMGDFKFVGDVAWVKSENDLTADQKALEQKVDADMYSLGLRAQYRFEAGSFSIVPSLGVRVSRLETDAMQLGSIRVQDQEQTLVQIPVSVKVSAAEQTAGSWTFVPSVKVAYIPTFGDKEIEAFGFEQEVIDTNPVQGELGIAAKNGNLTLNVGLTGGAGSEGMSNYGGRIGLSYAF